MYEINILINSIWFQLRQIGPYWVIGLVAGSLVNVYLSDKIAGKMLGLANGKHKVIPICAASALGIASPLCMYGTVPVIAALGKKNVPQHLLAAFMAGSVLLNPNLISMSFALGWELAVARLVFSFICGALAGSLVLMFYRGKQLFSFKRLNADNDKKDKTFIMDLAKAFRVTAPYLLIGITITALCDRYIPPEWIAGVFGAKRGLGVLFATSLSIPLYACGGGTIPLLRMWMQAGMGPGDAIAFMIAGPATKINSLSAVKMILGAKIFLVYLGFFIIYAIISGFVGGFLVYNIEKLY